MRLINNMGFQKKEDNEDDYTIEDYKRAVLDNSELDETTLDELVDDKVEEFGGLVNEEAAVYLVAEDYGININKIIGKGFDTELKVEHIEPDMYQLDIEGLTINKVPDLIDGPDWKLRNVELGDETGTITLNLWNDQAVAAGDLERGNTVKIKRGYTKEYKGDVQLKVAKEGSLVSNGREIL